MANFYTIVPRLGNKTSSWKHISEIVTERARKYYCEPFLGSGFVFYRLKQLFPDMYCMIGDIDNELGNFWWQCLTNTERMAEFVETIPSSEALYQFLGLMKCKNDVERAVRFYYLAKMSGPGGARPITSVDNGKFMKHNINDGTRNSTGDAHMGRLNRPYKRSTPQDATNIIPTAHMGTFVKHSLKKKLITRTGHMGGLIKANTSEHMRKATSLPVPNMDTFTGVMNLLKHHCSFLAEDYERLINRANSLWGKDNYLLYLDPPYHGSDKVYNTKFDHDRFFEFIKEREFVLNYDDCAWVRNKYKNFNMKAYDVRKRKELLIWKGKPVDRPKSRSWRLFLPKDLNT